jgi:ribosome biogenesis GTPase / thiamine phosphate phosphatase
MGTEGTVVAGHGRDCLVQAGDALVQAKARSRRVQPVAGDRVFLVEGNIIDAVAPRRSEFSRSSNHRTKVIAANVTQVVMVAACEPPFSDELLCRMLVATEHAGLRALFVLNKIDLAERLAPAREMLAPFAAAGYTIIELSAVRDAAALRPLLEGHLSVITGQSGMGKSTLVKRLVPHAEVRIREISKFLAAGRQSTIAARLHELDAGSAIIDTPGIAEFGLAGLSARDIAAGFREFGEHAARCRFHDCRHLTEPGCAVRAAMIIRNARAPARGPGWHCACGEALEGQFMQCWNCGTARPAQPG